MTIKNKFLFLIKMVFSCLIKSNWLRSQDIPTFTEKYVNTNTEAEKEQLRFNLKKMDIERQAKALVIGISVKELTNIPARFF